jgi:hypothetical protein
MRHSGTALSQVSPSQQRQHQEEKQIGRGGEVEHREDQVFHEGGSGIIIAEAKDVPEEFAPPGARTRSRGGEEVTRAGHSLARKRLF